MFSYGCVAKVADAVIGKYNCRETHYDASTYVVPDVLTDNNNDNL